MSVSDPERLLTNCKQLAGRVDPVQKRNMLISDSRHLTNSEKAVV